MRLTNTERTEITRIISKEVKDAEIYIFGSRIDDRARGGDLDILVIGDEKLSLQRLLHLKILLKDRLGDQKIDLVYQRKGMLSLFAQTIKLEAVRL